jgi:hypothetical protein
MTEPGKAGSVLQSPIKPTFSLVIAGAPSVVTGKFYECEQSFPEEWNKVFQIFSRL